MVILPKKIRMALEEEDNNDETMEEGEEGDNEVVWMDEEGDPPDELRYNGKGKKNCCTTRHRWGLTGNYPVFTMVMVIYHYVERIWRILVTPILIYNIYYH